MSWRNSWERLSVFFDYPPEILKIIHTTNVSEVIEANKITTEELEIQKKLEVLALVDKLGNVSAASRQSGVSRDTIYSHLKLVKQGGPVQMR